jgi:predicted transcriptional regulator
MTDNPLLVKIGEHIEVGEQIAVAEQFEGFIPLTEEFHTVNNLIPDDQGLLNIPPDMLVIDALDIMRQKHYSQLPVLAGNKVLGAFSYRSFAENFKKASTGKEKPDLSQLRVIDFIEKVHYVQVSDDIEQILTSLNENDYLLVGQMDRLLGVITASDLARYFYRYASIMMLLGEIELTIRKIIQACIDDQQLQEFARLTLSKIYSEEKLPKTVNEMTFSDYAQMIGYGDCYPHFEKVFGQGEWQRKRARSKLEEIRELRDDAFHFKRGITTQDIDNLLEHREWLKTSTIAYEAKNKGA